MKGSTDTPMSEPLADRIERVTRPKPKEVYQTHALAFSWPEWQEIIAALRSKLSAGSPGDKRGEQFLRTSEPRECPSCWGKGYRYDRLDDEVPCSTCAETGKVVPYFARSAGGEPAAYIEHHKGGDNLVWEQTAIPCTPLYKQTVSASGQTDVWELHNRTMSMLFATEEAAKAYLSTFPVSVSGGMEITRRHVLVGRPDSGGKV
jgi:hypothetical protein